jgi:hypothetical protein
MMRDPGFYWVRLTPFDGSNQTVVAEFKERGDGTVFWFDGSWYCDAIVEVLSERLSPPGDLAATPLERATGEMFRCAKAEGFTLHMRFSRRRVGKAAPKKKAKR